MTEWSIAVGLDGVCGSRLATDEQIGRVAEALADFGPTVSAGPRGVTVRLAVEGKDAVTAADVYVPRILRAIDSVGCRAECVRKLEVTEWGLFGDELEEPTHPELVGISEIADLLGTSRQRASELARSAKFPVPLADLKAGPVWPKPSVLRFCEEWDRKPGRPRSKTAAYLEDRIAARRDDQEARA